MKKRWMSVLTALVMTVLLCVPAFAEAQLPHVTDEAGLLTAEEVQDLEQRAQQISDEDYFEVYILTVEDFTLYTDSNDVYSAAVEIYGDYDLGRENDNSGLLLLLSMEDRDFALIAYGYGNVAFTDYGKDYLSEAFLDDFSDDEWYEGFSDYLTVSREMVQSAHDGSPVDVEHEQAVVPPAQARGYGIAGCVVLGFIVAFIVRGVLKGQLKSVAMGTTAEAYAATGIELSDKRDQYINTTQSRIYDPPEKSDSGGGTTVDSGGYSGKTGKF